MSKNIVLITTITAIALIGLVGALAYLGFSQVPRDEEQGGQGMREEQPVGTLPELPEVPVVQPKEPTITEPTDTSDWKTYRNEEYGFEMRYPGNYYVSDYSEYKRLEDWLPYASYYVPIYLYLDEKPHRSIPGSVIDERSEGDLQSGLKSILVEGWYQETEDARRERREKGETEPFLLSKQYVRKDTNRYGIEGILYDIEIQLAPNTTKKARMITFKLNNLYFTLRNKTHNLDNLLEEVFKEFRPAAL
jgi:hypothetical protein